MERENRRTNYLPIKVGGTYYSRSYLKLNNIRNVLKMIYENYSFEAIKAAIDSSFSQNDIIRRAFQAIFEKKEIAAEGIYEFIDSIIEHTETQTRLTDEITWSKILDNAYRSLVNIIKHE